MLDEVALAWERYRDGDITVLRATLPLSGPRERSVAGAAGSLLWCAEPTCHLYPGKVQPE